MRATAEQGSSSISWSRTFRSNSSSCTRAGRPLSERHSEPMIEENRFRPARRSGARADLGGLDGISTAVSCSTKMADSSRLLNVGLLAEALLKDTRAASRARPRLTWNTLEIVQAARQACCPNQAMHSSNSACGRRRRVRRRMSAHHYFRVCLLRQRHDSVVLWADSERVRQACRNCRERIARFPASGELNYGFRTPRRPSDIDPVRGTALAVDHGRDLVRIQRLAVQPAHSTRSR